MDAAKLLKVTTMVALSVTIINCGNGGSSNKTVSLFGQSCDAQVIKKSFLVEWNDGESVPKEFDSMRIHPGSRITRFKGIDKDVLEATILKNHGTKIKSAEHEFFVNNVLPKADACKSVSLPSAWGPGDVQAPQAWAASGKRGDGIIVAVVDSGVDITHSLLTSRIWTNPGEIPANGIDDDRNGYIDDIHGYNFADDNADPSDAVGHGTHVSGIIAGQAGPLGFTGIAPNASIMPLRFISADGGGSVGDAIAALEYAANKGAKVINASWGGPSCSDLLKTQIQNAISHGSVIVNAAGNSGKDLNDPRYLEWPAAFQIPGKITVGAMNQSQILSVFSNYGVFVDLAAPGETILSTYPPQAGQSDTQMCGLSGTSMATPMVAGVAALVLSVKPTLSPVEVTNILNGTIVSGRYGVRTGGKVNALKAVQAAGGL